MSSDFLNNLSYSINIPKAVVHSKDVITAVNKILGKFYFESYYKGCFDFPMTHRRQLEVKKPSALMQSEKIILCEINACLWMKALYSAISSITNHTYPHYIISQKFINYVLNSDSSEYFYLVEEYFEKLLLSHPPKADMFEYYWQIMSDYFVIFNEKKTEEQALIFCLIEAITNSLKITVNSDHHNELEKKTEIICLNETSPSLKLKNAIENFNILLTKSPEANVKRKQLYFVDLPKNEKIHRCFIALTFVYNILEADFTCWLQSNKSKPSFSDSRPLLSHLLWQNVRDIGLINKEVHKILDLYATVNLSNLAFQNRHLTEVSKKFFEIHSKTIWKEYFTNNKQYESTLQKLVTLLGELIRCSDKIEEIKYPFVGLKCDSFFRELSIILYECIKESKVPVKENEVIVKFKPPWLRLCLCSRVLSLITGYQCLPELTGVYDILEHIALTENRSQDTLKTPEKSGVSLNSRLMQKLKRMKSINVKCRSGKTLLHLACEENDTEKIKALLTFPELDVNAADREGWTPLHAAAYRGNEASVQELLSFSPKRGKTQKSVNTRARGPESVTPLMCAASQNHANICRLLLEHSGSILLEDVNESNQTSLELTKASDVLEILEYYRKNNVWTLHSHSDINFNSDLKEVVLKLCVEMIQAYFCTYRTWDVYKTLKRDKDSQESSVFSDVDVNWDYMRYHRDIKRNIYKLRRLVHKLEPIKEFKDLYEVYMRILSFNAVC